MALPRHGMFGTPEYTAWAAMWQRCTNVKCKAYKNYGGRGIAVSPRWRDFAKFYEDVGPRPAKGYQLDRKKNNKNYTPSNTHWVKAKANIRNRRHTLFASYKGKTVALAAAAEAEGLAYQTVLRRYDRGWREPELFQPARRYRS